MVFYGDMEGLRETQIDLIQDVLDKRGYKGQKVTVEGVGKKGDNYIANVKRVTVEKEGKTFKMIAKIAPELETMRRMVNADVMFKNEIIMYTKVLPKYNQLYDLHGVPDSERYKFAECYGYSDDAPNELILLEDLKESNCTMFDRFESLSDESMKFTFRSLARLHAASYALKYKEPETYKIFRDSLINSWVLIDQMEPMKMFTGILEEDVCSVLDKEKHKKAIKGTVSQMIDLNLKFLKYDADSKHAVIQQGDCWTNNIMFKLKENQPVEAILIDYQLSKESNPAADIHYLVAACTDKATRDKYYHGWIDYYHSELDQSLSNFHLKVNFVYPRDQLDADLRRLARLGIGMGIILASILTRESEDTVDIASLPDIDSPEMIQAMDSLRVVNLNAKTLPRFKKKVEGMLETLLELGYL